MREQFKIIIVEPFIEKKIGVCGEPWGILLDGLDEVEGQRPQRNIIQFISTFVRERPESPLVWLIASRPEVNTSDTFGEEEVVSSYWEERVPVDSTEACEDVQRFLRASFKAIGKESSRSIPNNWPGEATFLKLAGAASGLSAFVTVAIRFFESTHHSNPVSRLNLVLFAIDSPKVAPPEDQPFAYLNALYTQILCSISPDIWTSPRLCPMVTR